MALSIYSVLRQCRQLDQDLFAVSLASHYESSRGYGMTVRAMIQRIRKHKTWRGHADGIFKNEGSFGNGCASRVPPLGAYFAGDLDKLVEQAGLSASVTHAHPEAVAGTIAVAVASALAWISRHEPSISHGAFLDKVIAFVPPSVVREKIAVARDLANNTSVETASKVLGNGSSPTVQETVPFALWCAAKNLLSYEEAIWQTLQGQGDCDTTCAIVGGIVVMRMGIEGIPNKWKSACEPFPDWIFNEQIL